MQKVISNWQKLFNKFIQNNQFSFELITGKYLENEGVNNMTDDCKHSWLYVPDWEGDPSLPNGVNDVSYWVCDDCGMEQNERPEGIESEYPGPDFDKKDLGGMIDEAVDYVYDPLRNEP